MLLVGRPCNVDQDNNSDAQNGDIDGSGIRFIMGMTQPRGQRQWRRFRGGNIKQC